MAKSKADIMKLDLYGILGVGPEATDKQLVKAYRKKALKCHPDKNPDNPKAAELFHELSRALEILTDPSAKAAYDIALKAKKLAEERNRVLDSKRKKLKDDLEEREKSVDQRRSDEDKIQRNLVAEIERLRKEGSQLLEQEQELMKQQLRKPGSVEADSSDSDVMETPKIKIRWNANKADTCDYTKEDLEALFSRYGEISNIIISTKKKGTAIIEFESHTPVLKLAENELGTNANPLKVIWLSGNPSGKLSSKRSSNEEHVHASTVPDSEPSVVPGFEFMPAGYEASASSFTSGSSVNNRDFESLVLMKMRQAEERKRLIEQIQKEDEEEEKKTKK